MGTVHGTKWKNKLYRNVAISYTTNHSNVAFSIGGMVQCFILKVCEKIGKL